MAEISFSFVVCGFARPREELPPHFHDNIEGPCADCGTALMWRPESPPAPRICHPCAFARAEKEGEPPVIVFGPGISEALEALIGEPEGSC